MMESPRWLEITPSEYPWEREALVYLRERLPDHEPYRAWSNFEFIASNGAIYEVDLLVLTPKGFFLVEIKSRPGHVTGDAGTWTWQNDGRRVTDDNPLILANRKAKALIGLLRQQAAMRKVRSPFLEARVFLSAEGTTYRLPEPVSQAVDIRDVDDESVPRERRGIVASLTRWADDSPPKFRVDKPIAKALTRAMEQAGIRPTRRSRRVGDYELEELIHEGPNYQDWAAHHVALQGDRCRVRIYAVEPDASDELRDSLTRAAKREYQILAGISHEGILKARAYTEHDRGPALIFEHVKSSRRLDHYLAEQGESLSVGQRLELLRQVSEAVRFAHEKHLVHRALSPQNILVLDPDAATPKVQVFNWQTGIRESASAGVTRLNVSATSHLVDFVEEPSTVYMAPESLSERSTSDEQADVFSLGALAYQLFSGEPPAAGFVELAEKLREGKGLRISSVLDGAAESLQELVQASTHPQVSLRLDCVADFLEMLDAFEEEITTPDSVLAEIADPTVAKSGDRLVGGFEVKRRLGKGASSVALLVDREGKELVLKVALEPSHSARLRAEGAALAKLRHQFIVELHEVVEIGSRVGLLMNRAGDKTLAQRLREEGRLQLEMLERFGEDLLQTVDWLEQQGIPHRDIKPDNLGVAPMGRGDVLHLALFDFSLADTPSENIRAGTVPYLDPFLSLRKPPRWDTSAERFAAAMTLHQMATGTLPVWGDGESDPAVLDDEVTIDPQAFEPVLREPMAAFFEKALRRDYRRRFDNAQEMLGAWREIFSGAAETITSTGHGDEPTAVVSIENATLDTRLSDLGLTTRALNAMERADVFTVEGLVHFPLGQLRRMRGVGSRTRRELAELLDALLERFPESAAEPKQVPALHGEEAPADPTAYSVDALLSKLMPAPRTRTAKASASTLEALLGLADAELPQWPTQSEVARHLRVNPATVSQALARARQRWLKNPAMTSVRDDLVRLLEAHGGLMTVDELAQALLAARGSVQGSPVRGLHAAAVVRAAIETERDRAAPRWIIRRVAGGRRLLMARDEVADDGTPVVDGERLADYAEALCRKADLLAAEDPLRAPARVQEALETVEVPSGLTPPPRGRLLQIATLTSKDAALSSRLEIYPRGMAAERALRLSLGALAGAKQLDPTQVRERVAGRYAEAEPLPDRPALDALLEASGSGLRWQTGEGGRGAYVAALREFTTVSSETALARSATRLPRFEEVPEERVAVDQFDQRLRHSVEQQGFLALVVPPGRALRAEQALVAGYPVEVRSLDNVLIGHMRAFASENGIDWSVVLKADGTPQAERGSSRDWRNLVRVVRSVLPRIVADLSAATQHLLLTNPGLLARYGAMSLLTDLHEKTGREGGPPGLWLLVPGAGQQQRPTLDGQPVPVFTTAQWARIPAEWLAAQSTPTERKEALAS